MSVRILMILSLVILILPFLFSCLVLAINQNDITKEIKRKYDYKHTFKHPYYYNGTVPFFDTYGHTLLAPEFLRLAPSVPLHSGSIWVQLPNPHKEWEVELSFRISGNYFLGGRGIAFWYIKEQSKGGSLFGCRDKWDGLAIFFETVDHSRKRENPYIMAHINDGSTSYNSISDPIAAKMAGCYRMFRNTQEPIFAKISYINSTLQLSIDPNYEGRSYNACFTKLGVSLPSGYYFGVSASAEGATPDDHDILSFETYEINPIETSDRPLRPHEAEKAKKSPSESFEIPEDIKQRIETIQKFVTKEDHRDTREKDKGDPRNLDFIKGMQIRILESLDKVHEQLRTLGGSPKSNDNYYSDSSKAESQLVAVSQKLDKIISSISSLEARVSRIPLDGGNDHAIRDLKEDVQRIASKIESLDTRIAGQFYQTQRSFHDAAKLRDKDSSTTSTWIYLIYFALFAIITVGAYILYQTKMELDQKKFI
ncbi:legume-like lectin family-domain-containing protein [Gigaspora rosea]|uniref:Legume-like lectin family-domain-containing protein n=1 Tax=Gigaspora rosea TaxID=44941 RepID=A0A397U0E1_9GLOM|nr:legume-like lectin family-domain-containing protein [Gigaspora rosea]